LVFEPVSEAPVDLQRVLQHWKYILDIDSVTTCARGRRDAAFLPLEEAINASKRLYVWPENGNVLCLAKQSEPTLETLFTVGLTITNMANSLAITRLLTELVHHGLTYAWINSNN